MKAITLWQPWASLVGWGYKTIETRTHNRFASLEGQQIAIHAGKKFDKDWKEQVCECVDHALFLRIISSLKFCGIEAGSIVCVARVKEARRLTIEDNSRALCDCEGKYGLVLEYIRPVTFPAKGKQGIWNVDFRIESDKRINRERRNR